MTNWPKKQELSEYELNLESVLKRGSNSIQHWIILRNSKSKISSWPGSPWDWDVEIRKKWLWIELNWIELRVGWNTSPRLIVGWRRRCWEGRWRLTQWLHMLCTWLATTSSISTLVLHFQLKVDASIALPDASSIKHGGKSDQCIRIYTSRSKAWIR